jgi:hypothetical protein
MNILGTLPISTSPQFHLNSVDWLKVLRFLLVQAIGLFVTIGAPFLLKFTYTLKGTDYTPYVLVVVNAAAEAARRFLTTPPKT